MKIRELTIRRFRSLKEITWKPGDLNLIVGPNASGKSNLLKAIEMLSSSAQGRL
jgi:AAA15 family ATPase/GTPase